MGGRSPKGHPLCHTRYPTPMTPADDNTNSTPVILTAIADNRPNLLETILTTIGGAGGCEIQTVSTTPLETAVSITLLIRVPKDGTMSLRAALVGLTVQHNIKIHVDDMPDGALHQPATGETK